MIRSVWMTWPAACSLAVLIALAASVANADDASPAKEAEASEDPNPVICRTVPVTGSRLKSNKVCRTKSEWAGDATNAQGFMKDVDQGSAAKPRESTAVGR
jgi:hypothetical protein